MNYNAVIIISLVWLVINVLNVVLRSLFAYEFSQLLQSVGLTLRPIQILFKTQSFNRLFYVLSNWRPRLINKWFALGTGVTLLALISVPLYHNPYHLRPSRSRCHRRRQNCRQESGLVSGGESLSVKVVKVTIVIVEQ